MNRSLLREIYRRRKRTWAVFGCFVFLTALLIGLFVFPQSYSATASISLEQAGSGASPLAALAGLGTANHKYLGVLKSRRFAEEVERTANLQALYHLRTRDDAIEKLTHSVKFDENPDGLMYVQVSLDGPARFAPDPSNLREKVREASVLIGNGYTRALRGYMINTDTDKDTTLLRAADGELKKARLGYDVAVNNWIAFVRENKSPAGLMVSPAGSGGGSPEAGAIQALYSKRAQLEAEIKSSDAILAATQQIVKSPTSELSAIPSEDLLLTSARQKYNEALSSLQNLQVQYGDEHPMVTRAKAKLKIAERLLTEQAHAILQGHTTEQVKKEALQVEADTVQRQIAQAEGMIRVGRNMMTEFERLHSEVSLNLEVLKTTASRYAEMKLQTVSAASRMNVVDDARAEPKGKPGLLMISLISLLSAMFCLVLWMLLEYVVRAMADTGDLPASAVVN